MKKTDRWVVRVYESEWFYYRKELSSIKVTNKFESSQSLLLTKELLEDLRKGLEFFLKEGVE